MWGKRKWTGLAVALLAGALAVPAPPALADDDSDSDSAGVRVVRVDCTHAKASKHDRIAKALEKETDELIIEIDGICFEDVLIRRDFVTLRGRNQDPSLDGIRGAEPGRVLGGVGAEKLGQGVVQAVGGDGVRLEHLSIGEGLEHRSGVLAVEGAIVTVQGCRVENNPEGGVGADGGSTLFLVDSLVAGNVKFAAAVARGGYLSVVDSEIFGGFLSGLLSGLGGVAYVRASTLSGTVSAFSNSLIDLEDVEHTGFFNLVATDSSLRLIGSTLQGLTVVADFSKLVVRQDSTVEGDLGCEAGGDAYCEDPLDVLGSSDCGQCFKP